MSELAEFTSELDALHGVAAELGKTLLVADLAVAAGIAGAPDFRARLGAFLGGAGPAQNPPCGCRGARNPPILASLKTLGRGALTLAQRTAAATLRGLRKTWARSPGLVITLVGGAVAWDVLAPSEAAEVQKYVSEAEVYKSQLDRLPPRDALAAVQEVSRLYGDSGPSLGSVLKWAALIGVAAIALPPIIRRVTA